jgi:hypothetical protein
VMEDGVSGYVVSDIDTAVAAINNIGRLARKKVRKYFEQHFTAAGMTQDYLRIYERMISRRKAPLKIANGALNWMKLTSPSSTT